LCPLSAGVLTSTLLSMFRGKGGKGLGKGGAKRHRKVLRDNIQVRIRAYLVLRATLSQHRSVGLSRSLLSRARSLEP